MTTKRFENRRFDHAIGNERIINAGTAFFGNVIEYDNRLVVIGNGKEDVFVINGPITRWRLYPRSKNYLNHLHVVLDNCVNIYSFGNDYFQNQESKRMGAQYYIKRYDYKKNDEYKHVDSDPEDDEQLPF